MNADDIRNAIAEGKEVTGIVGGGIVKITRVTNNRSVEYVRHIGGTGYGACDIADIHDLHIHQNEEPPCA